MKRKSATMKDIAQKLDLSVNAVSLALNGKIGVSEETRRLVLSTAYKMGYEKKKEKAAMNTSVKSICVLLKYRFFRDFQFYGRILLGIEETAKRNGYDVLINSDDQEEIPACVQDKRVAGIIIVGQMSDQYLTRLMEYQIPVVLADHQSYEHPLDCILSNNYFGTYQMTTRLLQKGYTRIGFFGEREYTLSTRTRFLGMHGALQERLQLGDFQATLDYMDRFSAYGDIEKFVINQEAENIFNVYQSIPEKPEALLCSNDEMAILLINVLQKHGVSVPEDVAIVGFDDIEAGLMVVPPLTTVHVQKKMMGQKAVERLFYRMEHPEDAPEWTIINVSLVERESA